MLDSIGGLQKHWHVVALASELRRGKSLKRKLYGHPLLLWRDADGELHALDDCCAHQHTPIRVADHQGSSVVCPYHGWRFAPDGRLVSVPSDAGFASRSKCSIPSYSIRDVDGFVWLCPIPNDLHTPRNTNASIDKPIDLLGRFRDWQAIFLTETFTTTDELLIENFMDPTHTAVVHDGLIRSAAEIRDHEMQVTTDQQGVRVVFAEQPESVGLGGRLLFGKSMSVQHTDEFLLPNIVRVTYKINGHPRFLALIACTPSGPANSAPTQAFVQLRYDFGLPSVLVSPILRRLAKKVIRQDDHVTAAQFANRQHFSEQPPTKVAADVVATRVQQLRRRVVAELPIEKSSTQTVKLRF